MALTAALLAGDLDAWRRECALLVRGTPINDAVRAFDVDALRRELAAGVSPELNADALPESSSLPNKPSFTAEMSRISETSSIDLALSKSSMAASLFCAATSMRLAALIDWLVRLVEWFGVVL